jgi:hypothetical protein
MLERLYPGPANIPTRVKYSHRTTDGMTKIISSRIARRRQLLMNGSRAVVLRLSSGW